ncbi:glycosyltransferase family 4 protein [Bacteroides sp.]|uniref:glycosyltransferase family 4 protein n=1 Tax=Bacteroides sp. TaxID=29523 RepID=UPI001EB11C40|nr:glycosyltransferase family 4 protein [Bacteroides sp.]MBS5057226.1 glycosyltransferase family 4 protein [Bacteroides sp.]
MLRNVVIVNDWASIEGGAANVAINSAIGLAEMYSVYLFSAVRPIDSRLKKAGVNVICIGKKDILHDDNRLRAICKGLWDNETKREFERLLTTLDPAESIVHFHTWTKALTASLYAVTAKMDFKTVITLHDFFCFCPNGGFYNYQRNEICTKKPMGVTCLTCNCDVRSYPQKIWRSMRMMIQNRVLAKNRKIYFISISDLTRRICTSLINSSRKVYTVVDPVEINENQPNKLLDNNVYLFMARLSPEKGGELFCQAITDLNLKGVVLGDGYLRNELMERYPNIEFVGWVTGKDKQVYFKQAKAFVFTSLWYETFGLSVAEARSYGIPCIVPDSCAASEQVIDGETGYLFKTGDLNSLKEALIKYENADIQVMQNNIINNFIADNWSLTSHIKNLVQVYNEIIIES